MSAGIVVNVVFLLCMGVAALCHPRGVTRLFGMEAATPDARNEVRAVYGGFGVALAVLLLFAAGNPGIRAGVLLCVGVALLGMAAGRVAGFFFERTGRWPLLFLVVEVVLGGLLLADLRRMG